MVEIVFGHTGANLDEAQQLFREYAASIGISLDFQNFEKELASLPGSYAPPKGRLLIARWNDEIAGCIALRELSNGACEMKRLYVRPQFRGLGIGKALCERLIQEAQKMGYKRMRLDTLPFMTAARGLYLSLGFKEIESYTYNPIEGASYLELELV